MTQTQLNHLYWAHEREHFRNDIRIGRLQALIANTKRDPRKQSRPYEALDFVHPPKPERERIRKFKMQQAANKFTDIIKTLNVNKKQNS